MSTETATPGVAVVHVHPTVLSFFAALTAAIKKYLIPAVAVAEQVAPIAVAVDPAIGPEVTGAEAIASGVEKIVGDLPA